MVFVHECGYRAHASPILLLIWSFSTAPSLSWSLTGSACKELGYICPLDDALLPTEMCPSLIFLLNLTLNTEPVLGVALVYLVWYGYSLLVLPLIHCLGSDKYCSVCDVPMGQVKPMVTDAKSMEFLYCACQHCCPGLGSPVTTVAVYGKKGP